MKLFYYFKRSASRKGFILPFTMLISTVVLYIISGSMVLLQKQFYFSKLNKQSQAAYYAADDAMACATSIDDTFYGDDGLGIFPSDQGVSASEYMQDTLAEVNSARNVEGLPLIADVTDIRCGQSVLFDTSLSSDSQFTVTDFERTYVDPNPVISTSTELGRTSSFNMKMDLGDGEYRCAKVTINKTPSFRQIISQGYANCSIGNSPVERAVVNTTISE